jgi:hypothetical protein
VPVFCDVSERTRSAGQIEDVRALAEGIAETVREPVLLSAGTPNG